MFEINLHNASIATGSSMVIGYIILNMFVRWYFFFYKGTEDTSWKSNKRTLSRTGSSVKWWIPFADGPKPNHLALSLINLFNTGLVGTISVELILRGYSKVYYQVEEMGWVYYALVSCVCPFLYQGFIEYWWHRTMHLPFLYKNFHKIHHAYKSPQPFDDMYVHPLEAFIYYMILWSPPFVFPMHYSSIFMYIGLCGTIGLFDHSGVDVVIPGLYNSKDHDLHHLKFNSNFGFPFCWTDVAFGTRVDPQKVKEYQIVPPASSVAPFVSTPKVLEKQVPSSNHAPHDSMRALRVRLWKKFKAKASGFADSLSKSLIF